MSGWLRGDGWPPAPPALATAAGEAAWWACITELAALKPGNVGLHGDGHDMRLEDFVASAACTAVTLDEPGAGMGERVLAAVRATRAAVGCNTNLGIVLLCAPLSRAALLPGGRRGLRARLRRVLRETTREDTARVFEAIRLAAPAGLGDSDRHDVNAPPAAELLAVMQAARRRDRIARQYVTAFDDVFRIGLPALREALAAGHGEAAAAAGVYLAFLARVPDTHICRKLGPPAAGDILRRARDWRSVFLGGPDDKRIEETLLAADGELKSRGINPGTSADLTVATLMAWRLGRTCG